MVDAENYHDSGLNVPKFDMDRLNQAGFEIAVGNVRTKFEEALRRMTDADPHLYWGVDWIQAKPDDLAFFTVASDYSDAIEGRGETFELGVPILRRDQYGASIDPVISEPDSGLYFVWRKTRDSKPYVVNSDTYSGLFESATPLVENFGSKLWNYKVVGYKMKQEGA
ncbi:MAG: hypothetical protein ABI220_02395 [Candidatus Saccharimonadales bacterium]